MAPRGWQPRLASIVDSRTMRQTRTAIQLFRRSTDVVRPAWARAAVSLHSHSDRSREKLDFVPGIARRIPVVATFFEGVIATYRRVNGRDLDFDSASWRPPMSPAAVIASEREQIERRFNCPALVSLTDHDTVEGPLALRANDHPHVPLSLEWSVPFDGAMFHLGVHGIAPACLDATERALAEYTVGATRNLAELLDGLAESPETFVVVNHPYWDLAEIGGRRHDSTLLAFLRLHGDRVHALELNGYRSWSENRRVPAPGRRLRPPGCGWRRSTRCDAERHRQPDEHHMLQRVCTRAPQSAEQLLRRAPRVLRAVFVACAADCCRCPASHAGTSQRLAPLVRARVHHHRRR